MTGARSEREIVIIGECADSREKTDRALGRVPGHWLLPWGRWIRETAVEVDAAALGVEMTTRQTQMRGGSGRIHAGPGSEGRGGAGSPWSAAIASLPVNTLHFPPYVEFENQGLEPVCFATVYQRTIEPGLNCVDTSFV